MNSMLVTFSGGPADGMALEVVVPDTGRAWTFVVHHGATCMCQWCALVIGPAAHVYERNDDDVFRYRQTVEEGEVGGPLTRPPSAEERDLL